MPLFVDAKILLLSILTHDTNCKTAPPNLLDLFTRIDSVHSFNTRSALASAKIFKVETTEPLLFAYWM